ARLEELEADHAVERQAREQAEARTRRLEAERSAARQALEALRRQLDLNGPDPDVLDAAPPIAEIPEPPVARPRVDRATPTRPASRVDRATPTHRASGVDAPT